MSIPGHKNMPFLKEDKKINSEPRKRNSKAQNKLQKIMNTMENEI